MTLRLRLVLGLVALVVVGLAVFGITTYVLYARSSTGGWTINCVRAPCPAGLYRERRAQRRADGGGSGGGGGGDPAGCLRTSAPILVPGRFLRRAARAAGWVAERRHPGLGIVDEPTSPSRLDCPRTGRTAHHRLEGPGLQQVAGIGQPVGHGDGNVVVGRGAADGSPTR